MRTMILAALLAAGCGAESGRSFTPRSTADRGGPSACAFGTNPTCGVTDCCEFDSVTHPGYREEYVCCGGIGSMVKRICSCPGCETPCGTAGKFGCAVCEMSTYSQSCNVHP